MAYSMPLSRVMSIVSQLHQTARAYAEAGFYVFPCEPGAKVPRAGSKGVHEGTTDLVQIDQWWSENPDYNIGLALEPSGLSVIDLDRPKKAGDPDGEDSWRTLAAEHGDPDTFTVRTPGGGRHLYFASDDPLPPSVSRVGDKIDTRGRNSYVLIPPSVIDGKPYEVIHDREFALLPEWIRDRARSKDTRVVASVRDLDLQPNISRARNLLTRLTQSGDIAIEGRGGDARTYRLACELSNLGLSPEVSCSLLEELWNPHCQPPWDHEELLTKITNAAAYAQNEPGAWAVAPAAEVFGPALDTLPPEPEQPAHRILVRAVKGSRAALKLLPPLVLHGEEGSTFTPGDLSTATKNAASVPAEAGDQIDNMDVKTLLKSIDGSMKTLIQKTPAKR